MINANEYKSNVYSQNGEDGIIKMLLQHVERTGFVIEFGAADGCFCSNTAKLWKDNKDCQALLIESNPDLFAKLEETTRNFNGVTIEKAEVRNIDDHTTRVADVCSIDVDGNDYEIALRMQTPHKIVIVEHNPTVPPHVDMIGIEDTMYGSSAKSIHYIMEGKGYTLVAVTKTNMIFMHGDHTQTFESRLEVLFDYSSLNYVVTTYQGEYDLIGEFGYGFSRPVNLRLKGPGLNRKTMDSDTLEHMRQMLLLQDDKENS